MPSGIGEWVVVLLIVVVLFGASRLPQVGEGLGKAIRGLKRGLQNDDDIDVTPERKKVAEQSSAAPPVTSEVADAEVVNKDA